MVEKHTEQVQGRKACSDSTSSSVARFPILPIAEQAKMLSRSASSATVRICKEVNISSHAPVSLFTQHRRRRSKHSHKSRTTLLQDHILSRPRLTCPRDDFILKHENIPKTLSPSHSLRPTLHGNRETLGSPPYERGRQLWRHCIRPHGRNTHSDVVKLRLAHVLQQGLELGVLSDGRPQQSDPVRDFQTVSYCRDERGCEGGGAEGEGYVTRETEAAHLWAAADNLQRGAERG